MWDTELTSINTKKGKLRLIGLTGLITFLFTNIFEPFDTYSGSIDDTTALVEIALATLGVVVSMLLSNFILRKLFRLEILTYLTIIPWFLIECLIISISWTALTFLLDGITQPLANLVIKNFVDGVFLISLPFFSVVYILNSAEKRELISELKESIREKKIDPETVLSFVNKTGKEQIKLRLQDTLYLESSNNYVTIYYLQGSDEKKLLIRNTIKNFESQLAPYQIVRCHRSYLVNLINIQSKESRSSGDYFLIRNSENTLIPISKPYLSEMEKVFR